MGLLLEPTESWQAAEGQGKRSAAAVGTNCALSCFVHARQLEQVHRGSPTTAQHCRAAAAAVLAPRQGAESKKAGLTLG